MSEHDERLVECAKREIERADSGGYDPTADGRRFGFLGTAGNVLLVLVGLIALVAFVVHSCQP